MQRKMYVAGGCFWGVQEWFRRVKGVFSSQSYYLNGGFENVDYKSVCRGSGRVKGVELVYDDELLKADTIFNMMLQMVNPFSLNKQGNDVGVQYRIGFYFEKDDLALMKEFERLVANSESEVKQKTTFELTFVQDKTKADEGSKKFLTVLRMTIKYFVKILITASSDVIINCINAKFEKIKYVG